MAHVYLRTGTSISESIRDHMYDGCLSGGIPAHHRRYDRLVYDILGKEEFTKWLITESFMKQPEERCHIEGNLLVFHIRKIPWNILMLIKQTIYVAQVDISHSFRNRSNMDRFMNSIIRVQRQGWGQEGPAYVWNSTPGDMTYGGRLLKLLSLCSGNMIAESEATWADVIVDEEWKLRSDTVNISIANLPAYKPRTFVFADGAELGGGRGLYPLITDSVSLSKGLYRILERDFACTEELEVKPRLAELLKNEWEKDGITSKLIK